LATLNVEIAYNQIVSCVTTGIAFAMSLNQIAHDNTVVSAGNAKPRLLTPYDPNIQIPSIPRPERFLVALSFCYGAQLL
jgi:hypothetical protein